jgi:hypothetical protein
LDRLLAPFAAPTSDGPVYTLGVQDNDEAPYAVWLGEALEIQSASVDRSIDHICWHVSQQAAARTDDLLVLHGAAVSIDGRGIVIPGEAGSGKTTLAAALTAAGASYLTDEWAMIDPATIRVRPFPRALWIHDGSIRAIEGLRERLGPDLRGRQHIAPADLRGGGIGSECPVCLVVFPRYVPGARTSLLHVDRAQGLRLLGAHAVNLAALGRDGFAALSRIARAATFYALTSGGVPDAVDAVAEAARRL